jgi:hypothetical protein
VGDWNLQRFRDCGKLLARTRDMYAAARVNHWTLGTRERIGNTLCRCFLDCRT